MGTPAVLAARPNIQDGVHQRPRRFDGIPAIKQRRIAAQAIVQQRGVGAARATAKRLHSS